MDADKRARIEAKGFKVGTVAELLGLSPEEQAVVEVRLAMARTLREQRLTKGVQQTELATAAKTTQKRVSLMESGDSSISLDKLLAANVALGMPAADLLRQVSDSLSEPYVDHRHKQPAPRRRRVVDFAAVASAEDC